MEIRTHRHRFREDRPEWGVHFSRPLAPNRQCCGASIGFDGGGVGEPVSAQ
jgi:hypothetical protein